MKKASFIIGMIGGIFGILCCAFLLFSALNMKVTEADANKVLLFSIIGLIISIVALVGACIVEKNKIIAGIFMILGAIIHIPCSLYSLSADNPVTFIGCAVVTTLFSISGVMALCLKK